MCGIVGVTGPSIDVRREREAVIRMRETMTHRGPDGDGIWSGDNAVLGHRRLSIVDLTEAGRQPMSNEDGTIWITFNGEIYNHAELRQGLERRGHTYRSRCDTETIIHLYEEKGSDCVHDLLGMFALAIWDSRRKELFLARDRLGVKPLYYAQVGGRFLFASEIKALLAHPDVPREMDEDALYHYLTFLVTPPPLTLFRGIAKLPAGCRAIVRADGQLRIDRYWDAISDDRNTSTDEENAERLRGLLRDSISKRMMSDVPFGVLLSGGLDSSTNVALMAEQMARPVETFSVGFKDDPEFNELRQADAIARRYGTNHHEVLIGSSDLEAFLHDLVFFQDEPIADPVCVPLYYVAKLAKESGTTVVQVGEGADELFCGYSGYMRFLQVERREWRTLSALPDSALRAVAPAAMWWLERTSRRDRVDFVRRARDHEELFWGGAIVFTETDKQRLVPRLSDGSRTSSTVVDSVYREIDQRHPDAGFLERMTYLELKLRLPELLLMRVDKMSMASSVEARVPFLDHRLVEFAMGLSTDQKIRGGVPKNILKRAVVGLVPSDVISREKQGFGVPISSWFRAGLGDVLREAIAGSSLPAKGLINFGLVSELLERHESGAQECSFKLWVLLNLVLWHSRWCE